MNDETARALNAINRRFYRERAAEFSATRADPWPGWTPLLELLEQHGLTRDLEVLDVGCGNGRFAAFLADRLGAGGRLRYCGVDASRALLADTSARRLPGVEARTRCADYVETAPGEALPPGRFSLVALFGVVHGVPSHARRRALLRACAERLRPGGVLALTAWRLDAFPRLARKLVPPERFASAAGLRVDPAELEPGDHLLPWGEDGSGGYRYLHAGGEREAERLLAGLDLERLASWCADGREGCFNRYLVARAPQDRA